MKISMHNWMRAEPLEVTVVPVWGPALQPYAATNGAATATGAAQAQALDSDSGQTAKVLPFRLSEPPSPSPVGGHPWPASASAT